MKRSLLIAGLALAFALPGSAQTPFITLGKHQVHPTRILARYADPLRAYANGSTLSSLGLKTEAVIPLVSGLVVLDEAPSVSKAAVVAQPVSPVQRLLDRIRALEDTGLFEYVEPDYLMFPHLEPTDSAFLDGTLWGLKNTGQFDGQPGADIDAVRAWDITTGSTNVIVCVIDTGIRYTHQDLASQMWVNPGEIPNNGIDDDGNGYIDDVYGINAIVNSGDPFDDGNHGTHVAGTIGAAANNSRPHVGVSWNVRLMAAKFLPAQGGGTTSDAIKCVDYAVGQGANIINASWGGGAYSQALFDSLARAGTAGVLFVASAGNSGTDNDQIPSYPNGYNLDNIVAVAALDRDDKLAGFSQYGRTTVDLGAPGVEIFSTWATSDSSYNTIDGTSMAAPHVSGVAALVLAGHPGAPLIELRERLFSSTIPVQALAGKTVTGGRVNAYQALTATNDGILELSVSPPSGSIFCQGTVLDIFVQVSDLFRVTNATVTGSASGIPNVIFRNDGVVPDAVANDATYTARLVIPPGTTRLSLGVNVEAPDKTGVSQVLEYFFEVPAPNDAFAGAAKIQAHGELVFGDNDCATIQTGEPFHALIPSRAGSLWWNWSPLTSGDVIVDPAGSSFDTVLAVYTGDTLSSLTQVAAVDDVAFPGGGTLQGYVQFFAHAGVTYRIAVSGYNQLARGTVRLRVEPRGEPDRTPPGVIVVSPLSGQVVTETNTLTITGTAFDPTPNASGVQEVFVASDQDQIFSAATGTTNWSRTTILREGINTFRVVALDYAGNASAFRTFQVDYRIVEPVNDVFVNATALEGTSGSVTVNTTRATREVGEPNHAQNSGGHSVWWTWQAPADGQLSLNTAGSSFDTLLGLYLGESVTNLATVASNDDANATSRHSELNQSVRNGQVYRIAVDGYGGSSGTNVLNYAFTASTVHRITVNVSGGGSVTPGSGDYQAGAPVEFSAVPNAGWQFSTWQGAAASTDNPLTLTPSGDATLTAVFTTRVYVEDFETGGFSPGNNFSNAGNAPWRVQTNEVFEGRYSARSGSVRENQRSALVLQAHTSAGTGSFFYRVSSESGWDHLEFYVNGVLDQRWAGELQWGEHQFAVPAGNNTFEWRYSKDFSVTLGQDAAFIDNIALPSGAQTLSLMARSTKGNQFQLTGQPNTPYVIEASSDLVDWTPISTNSSPDGIILIVDPASAGHSTRFYRAVLP